MFAATLLRLSHLKLDGFRWGSAIRFCPKCDFQYDDERPAPPICPACDATLQVAAVTPALKQLTRAAA